MALLDLDATTAPVSVLGRLSPTFQVDVDHLPSYAELPFLDLMRRHGHDVVVSLRLEYVDWMAGQEPSAYLPDDAEPVHVGARMEASSGETHFVGAVAASPDASYLLVRYAPRSDVHVIVAARDLVTAQRCAEQVRRTVPRPAVGEGAIPLHTWHQRRDGETVHRTRLLDMPAWGEIAGNYPSPVRRSLDALMQAERPAGKGRLVLWHGPPGTGKTTALRALARNWRSWCDMHYISDAERMFDDLDYLDSVAFGSDAPVHRRSGHDDDRWRLVVAEDSDEYLRADARQAAGSALGRLLNLADGLLGQGMRTLILLTTNEPLHELHPALVRPGRALAKVEFSRFSRDEAQQWLGGGARPDAPMTLAELFERRGDLERIGVDPERRLEPAGMYM